MMRGSISPATSALMKAMSPGASAFLNRVRSVPWKSLTFEGERIELEFICKDPAEHDRAQALEREAMNMELVAPGAIFADIAATLTGNSFLVEAIVIRA